MPITTNNNGIDLTKFICAILVVIIHAQPFPSASTANFIIVDIIARVAVPFFFVCAGYFFFNKINIKNGKIENNPYNLNALKKYIVHLMKLYAFWTVFYLLWWIPLWLKNNDLTLANMKGYILSIFLTGSYFHLWYIVALIYGMVFTFFILRHVKVKLVIAIAILFYLIGTFAYSYTGIFKINRFTEFLLNVYNHLGSLSVGIFRTFPYLMMGFIFAKFRIGVRVPLSGLLSVMSLVLLGFEVWLLISSENSSKASYVLFTGVTVFFIFNTVSQIELKYNAIYPLLRKMSSVIYFVHPMFINIIGLIFTHYMSYKNSSILFVTVLGCAVLFSTALINLSHVKYFNKLKSVY